MTTLTVAVWQMDPTPRDVRSNLKRLRKVATQAKGDGAGLLVTPELSLTGYDIGELSDDLTGPEVLDGAAGVAAEAGVNLVVGLAQRDGSGQRNCSAIIDREGTVRALYRKAHLFGSLDQNLFVAGESTHEITELDGVRVATLVCYDVEFPEAVRGAALAGAHLLAVPTANMHPYELVNTHVVPVRAWENQIYIAYANHHGSEGDTHYVGRSLIAAPDFTLTLGGSDSEGLLFATIDTEVVERAQESNPYLSARRDDLYPADSAVR